MWLKLVGADIIFERLSGLEDDTEIKLQCFSIRESVSYDAFYMQLTSVEVGKWLVREGMYIDTSYFHTSEVDVNTEINSFRFHCVVPVLLINFDLGKLKFEV